ncbi:hypothetical protein FQZ97_1265890 [compost metagenome]
MIKYFIEMMRNEDDSHTTRFQQIEQLEKAACFMRGQRRCRFIKDQDTAVAHQCPGNFNELTMCNTQTLDRCRYIHFTKADCIKGSACFLL